MGIELVSDKNKKTPFIQKNQSIKYFLKKVKNMEFIFEH